MAFLGSKRTEPARNGALSVQAGRGGDIHTLLGQGSNFEGNLSFEGQVRIDGTFRGTIRTSDALILGETAHVEAEIDAGSVVVSGSFVGTIRATKSVELLAPAKVRGTIESGALIIAKGVHFDGTTKMLDDAPVPPPLPPK